MQSYQRTKRFPTRLARKLMQMEMQLMQIENKEVATRLFVNGRNS